jgi:predicted O-methyltransferase YrrM
VDPDRRRFAAELYAESHAHDVELEDRLDRFRNLEPPTAELLGILIRARGALRILELGTSNGYSTIWLADASAATDGGVVSVDIDPLRIELARENLGAAGLDSRVELRAQDAGEALVQSPESWWDFVRALAPRGLLAVDNVRSHEHELVEFTALIEAREELTQTVIPVGAGLRLAVRGP